MPTKVFAIGALNLANFLPKSSERQRQGGSGDRYHLDEVFCKINGKWVYLWRAVNQEGTTVDILLQRKRDKKAAKRFLKKTRKQGGCPHTVVTDKLKSYRKLCKEIFPDTQHIHDKGANNRAENSHQVTRLRERKIRRFKSVKQAQIFLSCLARVYDHFHSDRHLCSVNTFRILMDRRFEEW